MRRSPTKLHQVMITDEGVGREAMTDLLHRNIESFRSTYPFAEYRCYGNEEISDLIRENYPTMVLDAYRALKPYAYKADLARYCIVNKFGGLYADLSYLHFRPISFEEPIKMVVFHDKRGGALYSTSNAIFYADANNCVLKLAIERIVKNFNEKFYGLSSLDPTGPNLFGKMISDVSDWKSMVVGERTLLNVDRFGWENTLFLMPTGELVALRNKTQSSRISDLIDKGGNDYEVMWRERTIWGEPRQRKLVRKLTRLRAKLKPGGI